MAEQGHVLQSVPFGRDNIITIAKPRPDTFQRQPLSIQHDTINFNTEYQRLGDILQHCKRALLGMQLPDGSTRPFPENEFMLHYGKPLTWDTWYDLAKFAEWKIVHEGFLDKNADDWSHYGYLLREWALQQGHLPLNDPKFNAMVPGVPSGE